MIRRKLLIAGLLMAGFVMTSATNIAHAETTSTTSATSATQELKAVLDGYVIITEAGGCDLESGIVPDTGNLEDDLISKFSIVTNCAQDLYLYAHATVDGATKVAFFENGGKQYVALANTESGSVPSVSAFEDVTSGSSNAANNPNVIAYPIDSVTLKDLDGTTVSDPTYANNQYTIKAPVGSTIATTTIGETVASNTYDYNDQAGTYKAVVTLSTATL